MVGAGRSTGSPSRAVAAFQRADADPSRRVARSGADSRSAEAGTGDGLLPRQPSSRQRSPASVELVQPSGIHESPDPVSASGGPYKCRLAHVALPAAVGRTPANRLVLASSRCRLGSLPPLSFLVQFMLPPVLDGSNRGAVSTPRQIASDCDIFCRTNPAQCSHAPGERHATQTPRI